MKTDALIAMLASGPIAADSRTPARRILAATVVGILSAAAGMLAFLGPRPDLASAVGMPMFWLKLAVPSLLMALFVFATTRLSRPADQAKGACVAVAALVAVLWAGAFLDLSRALPTERVPMIVGASAWLCVGSIALLSLPLLAALFVTLRGLAPTRPTLAGFSAGALAGSAAALVYAVHCNEMALPFLALWYILGIAAPAALGAVAGSRVLRWA